MKIFSPHLHTYKRSVSLLVTLVLCVTLVYQVPSQALVDKTATIVSVNETFEGSIKQQEGNMVYQFHLDEPGQVSYTFAHPYIDEGTNVWDVSLFDSTDSRLLYSAITGRTDTVSTSYNAYLDAGDYYLLVTNPWLYSYSDASFSITINYTQNTNQFEIEKNDSRTNATPFTGTSMTGNMLDKADIDYYKLNLTAPSVVDLQVTHEYLESQGNYWEIAVFDENDNLVMKESIYGDKTVLDCMSLYLNSGDYYIRITTPFPAIYYTKKDYVVNLKTTYNFGNYENEFNDSFESATLLPALDNVMEGNLYSANDVDYYTFSVVGAGDMLINFKHQNLENPGIYWDIALYDSLGNTITTMASKGNNPFLTSETLSLPAGDYTLKVYLNFKYSYITTTPYKIMLQGDGLTLGTSSTSLAPSSWARETIINALDSSIVPNNLQSSYKNNITREEFAELLVSFIEVESTMSIEDFLVENNLSVNTSAFTDTSSYPILAANALGIVGGIGNNLYDPNGLINREQAATMLMRLQKALGKDVDGSASVNFDDQNMVSPWAIDGLNYVFANNIMGGVGNNNFSPKGSYTREQAIITAYRILSK